MAKKKNHRPKSKRLSFPEDEKAKSWLKLLLEAYYIVDRGVAGAVASEKKKGRKLACARGCSACCSTQKDIPVYPLEISGITWYVKDKVKEPVRSILKKQLAEFTVSSPCPFLVEGVCAIHSLRPMACRQFNVFNKPCSEGEDPYYTRREDVMDPVKKHVEQAFYIMLPFYGIEQESEKIRIVETGAFHKMVKELHACHWNELAEKMGREDRGS